MDLKNNNKIIKTSGYINIEFIDNYINESIYMVEELNNILINKLRSKNSNYNIKDIYDIIIWQKQMMRKLEDLCLIPNEYIKYM